MPAASGQGFDRPGCIHSVVNDIQSSARLRIENGTKPSFVAFWSQRDVRPEHHPGTTFRN